MTASARLNLQPMCATASRPLGKPTQGRVLIQITRHFDSCWGCWKPLFNELVGSPRD